MYYNTKKKKLEKQLLLFIILFFYKSAVKKVKRNIKLIKIVCWSIYHLFCYKGYLLWFHQTYKLHSYFFRVDMTVFIGMVYYFWEIFNDYFYQVFINFISGKKKLGFKIHTKIHYRTIINNTQNIGNNTLIIYFIYRRIQE